MIIAISGFIHTVGTEFINPPRRREKPQLHVVPLDSNEALALLEDSPLANSSKINHQVLLLHPFASKARSPLLERITTVLVGQGIRVFRLNLRGMGEGKDLSRSMYHGACHDDVAKAIEYIAHKFPNVKLSVIGFSMSADIVLNYASRSDTYHIPSIIQQFIAVCPALDPHHARRRIDKAYFGLLRKSLMGSIRKILLYRHSKYPDLGPLDPQVYSSVFALDERYVVSKDGFKTLEEYHQACDPRPRLDKIKHPTIMLIAKDDPVGSTYYSSQNPHIKIQTMRYGGHLGFLRPFKNKLGTRSYLDPWLLEVVKQTQKAT
jgi:uncharacterized protein